jgi:Septum formation
MSSYATEGARQAAAPSGDESLTEGAPVGDEPASGTVTGDVTASHATTGEETIIEETASDEADDDQRPDDPAADDVATDDPAADDPAADDAGSYDAATNLAPDDETPDDEAVSDQPPGDGDPDDSDPDDSDPDDGDPDYDDSGYDDPDDGEPEYDDSGYDDPGYGVYDDEFPYERPKVSKLAVVALITGILPLVPVAVITGIAALIGIRRSGRRGHGIAVSALFIAAAWIIVVGAVGTVGVLTHGFKKPVTITYKEASVFRLQEGDCINTSNGQQVMIIPCTTPHDAEVFGTFALTGAAWPGATAVEQQASSGCASRLSGYLNPELAISLAQTYVYPDKADWGAGTKTVVCEVHAASGQLSQSVRGGT